MAMDAAGETSLSSKPGAEFWGTMRSMINIQASQEE
jgi:hypothetical protein